jgi:hypothetical protein
MPECPICVERKRTIACCPRCDIRGCRDCMLRRAVENPLLPQCVGSCRGLTPGELHVTIGPGLISKAFRPALKAALLAHEQAQIPNTMAAVEAVKRQEAAKLEVVALENEHAKRAELIYSLQREQYALERRIDTARTLARSGVGAVGKIRTILRCQKPDCLGYADHTGTCLVCMTAHCVKCGENLPAKGQEEHVCNPDEVASMEAIAASAKPCPSCGAPTTRISGCPQMWCTYCRTGYKYDTLTISKGHVANPHHDEYMQTHGGAHAAGTHREPGDIPCGGFLRLGYNERGVAREVMPRLQAWANAKVPGFAELSGQCRQMVNETWWHNAASGVRDLAEAVTQASGRIRARVTSGNGKLVQMRVDYILKRLPEDEYSTALVRLDTRRRRDAELVPVFVTYETMLQDLDRRWLYLVGKSQVIKEQLEKDDTTHSKAAAYAENFADLYRELLWMQERVQEGLDVGAKNLGLKRLGRLGPDGHLRLN